ncbi:MAG: hypothetical protein PVJ41_11435 [Desulfobacterales bacterium]
MAVFFAAALVPLAFFGLAPLGLEVVFLTGERLVRVVFLAGERLVRAVFLAGERLVRVVFLAGERLVRAVFLIAAFVFRADRWTADFFWTVFLLLAGIFFICYDLNCNRNRS